MHSSASKWTLPVKLSTHKLLPGTTTVSDMSNYQLNGEPPQKLIASGTATRHLELLIQWRAGLRIRVPPQKLCTCHSLVRCRKRAANSRNTDFVVSSVLSPMFFSDTLRDKCANALHNTRNAMAAVSHLLLLCIVGSQGSGLEPLSMIRWLSVNFSAR